MKCKHCGSEVKTPPTGKLETCRYKLKDGKMVTKMFGMGGNGWDIEDGWYESPRAAMVALVAEVDPETVKVPPKMKPVDGRTKEGKAAKAKLNDNSSRTD